MNDDKILNLSDLRPGDLMFGPIGGFVPGFFPVGMGQWLLGELFTVGKLSVRHVGIIVQADGYDAGGVWRRARMVQAMPSGAEEVEVTGDYWGPKYAYARLPEDYPCQSLDAAAIARLFVREEVPYSFGSYVALAAWRFGLRVPRLERWIQRRRPALDVHMARSALVAYGQPLEVRLPAEAICSVLGDQAWTLAGKQVVMGTRSQIVTPGMLARQLWQRPGVLWGGAGMLESAA